MLSHMQLWFQVGQVTCGVMTALEQLHEKSPNQILPQRPICTGKVAHALFKKLGMKRLQIFKFLGFGIFTQTYWSNIPNQKKIQNLKCSKILKPYASAQKALERRTFWILGFWVSHAQPQLCLSPT